MLKAVIAWHDRLGGEQLCLWTANAYKDDAAAYADFLGDTTITVFHDDRTEAFVGIDIDYLSDVLKHEALLRTQPYPLVELLNAPLAGVHPVDALLWGYHQLALKRIETKTDVYGLLRKG